MARNIKVGDLVEIKRDHDGFFKGDWGKVVYADSVDNEYHVAMFGDKTNCPIFTRSEIKLMPSTTESFEKPFTHTVDDSADDMVCDVFTLEEFNDWLEELANDS